MWVKPLIGHVYLIPKPPVAGAEQAEKQYDCCEHQSACADRNRSTEGIGKGAQYHVAEAKGGKREQVHTHYAPMIAFVTYISSIDMYFGRLDYDSR